MFMDTFKDLLEHMRFRSFLKKKTENKPLTIVGSGNQKRDFINVKDVARAIKLSVLSKKKFDSNISSGKPSSATIWLS